MSNTILFSDPRFLNHDPGAGHPESPARLRAILASLQAHPIPGTSWASPRLATETELATVHAPAYLADLEARAGKRAQLDPDTVMSPGSWDAARLAAGASLQAVEEVWAGRADNAFVLCRPPGHHAEPGRAMGYCIFSNIGVAIRHAQAERGVGRVAVVDWDGGGRLPVELTDVDASTLKMGDRVEMTFRKLFTSDEIHNYFWKARPVRG